MSKAKLTNIETDSWELADGEVKKEENPAAFFIPSLQSRQALQPDDKVKLILRIRTIDNNDQEEDHDEGMWAIVRERMEDYYVGVLENSPECTDEIKPGMVLHFEARHITQIHIMK